MNLPKAHRRAIYLLTAVMVLTASACWFNRQRHAADEVADFYAGFTKSEILQQLGAPAATWMGHFGLPPLDWAEQFENPKSFAFERETGTLYVSVCTKNKEEVCFSSHWLPNGGVY
jgi:hypothetical protein